MDDTSSTSSSRSSDSPTEGVGAISPEEVTQKEATAEVSFSEGIQPPPLAYKSKGYPCPVSPEIASSAKRCLWEVDREQVDRSLDQELNRIMQEESLVKSTKWNYDFKQEKPLMGGWTWETAKNPPKFYQSKEIGQKGSKRKREAEDASSSGISAGFTTENISTAPLVKADTFKGESSTVPVSSTADIRPQKKLCTEQPPDNSSHKSDSSTNISYANISKPVDSSLKPSSTSIELAPLPSQTSALPSSTSIELPFEPSSTSSIASVVTTSSPPMELPITCSSTAPKAPSPSLSSSVTQSTPVKVSQTPTDMISSSGDSHLTTIMPIIEISSSSSSTSSSSNSPSSSNIQSRSFAQSGITIPATSFYQSNVEPPVSTSKRRKSSPGSSSSSTTSSSHQNLNSSSRSSNGSSSSSSTGSGPRSRHSPSSRSRSTTSGWLKYFR